MLIIDASLFLKAYRVSFPKPALTPAGIEGIRRLLAALGEDSDVQNPRWMAYMMATVKHECANTWQPITERGTRAYFDKYNSGTAIGGRLGNTEPGDGYRFRGRGYVQITGRRNYKSLGAALHMADQLVQEPEKALEPKVAYSIMSYGMRRGAFTGRKLEQFIDTVHCDYLNARRIINGLDQAQRIKSYAERLEEVLSSSEWTSKPVTVPAPTPEFMIPAAGAAAAQLAL